MAVRHEIVYRLTDMNHRALPWRTAAQIVFWPLVLSRLWMALWVYIGHAGHPFLSKVPGGWEGVNNWWLNPWTTYDSVHFLSIAASGYEPHNAVFFPLYPLLLRPAGPDTIAMAAWGVLLSNVCFAVALAVFYRLTTLDYSQEIARCAVWLLAFFPVTAYFSAVYTESLFLLFIVSTFYCIRRDYWALAAACAFLAALTRNSGAVIFLALMFECYRRLQSPPKPDSTTRASAILATVLPLVALCGMMAYFVQRFGGLTAINNQELYFRQLSWPWIPVVRDIIDVGTGQALELTTLLNLAATIAVFVLVALHWKRQPVSYSVFMLGIIMMHLIYGHFIPPYTLGAVRYVMTTFPFVVLLALHTGVLRANRLRAGVAWCIYLLLCAVMSHLFGQKAFIS